MSIDGVKQVLIPGKDAFALVDSLPADDELLKALYTFDDAKFPKEIERICDAYATAAAQLATIQMGAKVKLEHFITMLQVVPELFPGWGKNSGISAVATHNYKAKDVTLPTLAYLNVIRPQYTESNGYRTVQIEAPLFNHKPSAMYDSNAILLATNIEKTQESETVTPYLDCSELNISSIIYLEKKESKANRYNMYKKEKSVECTGPYTN